jgi:hypothetical protein
MKIEDASTSPVIINRRYELQETLGRGGMGVVYRARDILSGHPVALKKVTLSAKRFASASQDNGPNPAFALAQEFRTLATMRHPHIISVFDFGFDQQRQPYFTMEYLDGGRGIGVGLPGYHRTGSSFGPSLGRRRGSRKRTLLC